MSTLRASQLSRRLLNTDWDFDGSQSSSPFALFHWQPGTFASQIPAALIGLLSEAGENVLDPFCGVGTTLVEAQRLSRRPIGFDLNPISAMAAFAKCLTLATPTIERKIRALISSASAAIESPIFGANNRPVDPETVQLKWYTKETRESLAKLFHSIASLTGTDATIARSAFSSILLSVCRETRHWGYVCDNTKPQDSSIKSRDVLEAYSSSLMRLLGAYQTRQQNLDAFSGKDQSLIASRIECVDAIEGCSTLANESVDLVITSPPYFGVVDYIKAQRLSFEWFGIEIEKLRRGEIGARSKRHRHTARQDYIDELGAVILELARVLKTGRHVVMVIGESKKRGHVLDDIGAAALSSGLELTDQISRRVSVQRRQMPSLEHEEVLIFKKQ